MIEIPNDEKPKKKLPKHLLKRLSQEKTVKTASDLEKEQVEATKRREQEIIKKTKKGRELSEEVLENMATTTITTSTGTVTVKATTTTTMTMTTTMLAVSKVGSEMNKKWQTMHGFRGDEFWKSPTMVAESSKENRPKQGNKTLAHEYIDDESVLNAKMVLVAKLVKAGKCVTAYTGAGLSKASGIPDYATKSKETVMNVKQLKSNYLALPTYAHRVLVAMEKKGYLHHYVQQNHDGLPQKAGYPQEKINEIHGAWFDPSNPVIKFSGSLRSDLYSWMVEMEEEVDLCLCLGTSLSGMNADRIAQIPAEKAVSHMDGMLGTVIINLQQTPLDQYSSVRIWAKLDDAFRILAKELDLEIAPMPKYDLEKRVFWLPYNRTGLCSPDTCKMKLDLRNGQRIKIVHPNACNEGAIGKVLGLDNLGNFKIRFQKKKWEIYDSSIWALVDHCS